jgi:hypothetical protein
MRPPAPELDPPEPTRLGEVVWLEPYPDVLLEGLADSAPGPEARYEATEAISLAFVTALQLLPPRQRAVLVLRDVLGYHAAEVADILETTEESVTSALKRARATLRRLPPAGAREPPPAPGSAVEADLIQRLTRADDIGDVDGVVALLTEDVWVRMPPVPLEYQGRELAVRFLAAVSFPGGPHLPAGRDPSQRPTGVPRLRPGPSRRGPARDRAAGAHPCRRADLRDDAVRQECAGPLRAPPTLPD